MVPVCQNCGKKHEGRLVETMTDGDGKEIEIEVCKQARYKAEDFYKYIGTLGV